MDVQRKFREVFLTHGYEEMQPAPVFPSPDPTTLFTCATVSTFKGNLLAEKMQKAFLIQPCLRVQNLQTSLAKDFDPEYLSSFTMLGTMCPYDQFDSKGILAFFDLFSELKSRIVVKSSRLIHQNLFLELESSYKTRYDTHQPKYYVWKYGDELLRGEGMTFAIEQPSGEPQDVGNIVVIYRQDRPVAVEFGFGLETFTSRLRGTGSPYTTSEDYLKLGLDLLPSSKRLGDALITALRLWESGVIPGPGKASSILRKALRNACFIILSDSKLLCDIDLLTLARKINSHAGWLDLIETSYNDVTSALHTFQNGVSHIKNHASGTHLERKVHEYRLRYGIPESIDVKPF
jgi:Alanyl-tRNA synthetase